MNTFKKGVLSLLMIGATGAVFAQLPEIKGAEALMNQVPQDFVGAKKSIDEAGTIGGAESLAYYWFIKSFVYNGYASQSAEKYAIEEPDAALKSVIAMKKYYDLSKDDKKIIRKYEYRADDVLPAVCANAFNMAINHSNDSNFKKSLEIYEALAPLVKYDEDNREVLKTKMPDLKYNRVLINSYITAFNDGDNVQTRKYLNALINNKYADPNLHSYIAKTYESEGNKEKQLEAIKTGRAAFPESKVLITEEINYYIKNDDLITLKNAVDKEIASGKADANYYYIRGYVNDEIGSGILDVNGKKGSGERDTAAMGRAEKDYIKAIELDPSNLNSIYNLGNLYANYGNYWNQKASNLPMSATQMFDKYTAIEQIYFNKAIKYYEQARGFSKLTDAERISMFRTMKSIYAKSKNLDKVREMNSEIKALNK